jgi:hypothetical protein
MTAMAEKPGSDVAYAYAENYPEDTDKLMRMKFPHSDDSLLRFRCCPSRSAPRQEVRADLRPLRK